MHRLARFTAAFMFAGVVALGSAEAAAPSVPSAGFKVASGSVQATVNGETKTYKKGDTIPEQAVVTANSDATVVASNGMTISVKAGSGYQAAYTKDGSVDVKATGGEVKVAGYGNTYVLESGSEADLSGGSAQVVSGSVVYTDPRGRSQTLGAGQQLTRVAVSHAFTFLALGADGSFTTILASPPPPSQQQTTVSPSAP